MQRGECMSTTSITKGNGFTAISFTKPIAELRKYIYNGKDFFDKVDLSKTTEFWDKNQTIDIYSGKQMIYSCCVKELKIKGRWRKILMDAWCVNGNNYDYKEEYSRLLASL
jgi:hypothetical protein